jgi:hypothetical protein
LQPRQLVLGVFVNHRPIPSCPLFDPAAQRTLANPSTV